MSQPRESGSDWDQGGWGRDLDPRHLARLSIPQTGSAVSEGSGRRSQSRSRGSSQGDEDEDEDNQGSQQQDEEENDQEPEPEGQGSEGLQEEDTMSSFVSTPPSELATAPSASAAGSRTGPARPPPPQPLSPQQQQVRPLSFLSSVGEPSPLFHFPGTFADCAEWENGAERQSSRASATSSGSAASASDYQLRRVNLSPARTPTMSERSLPSASASAPRDPEEEEVERSLFASPPRTPSQRSAASFRSSAYSAQSADSGVDPEQIMDELQRSLRYPDIYTFQRTQLTHISERSEPLGSTRSARSSYYASAAPQRPASTTPSQQPVQPQPPTPVRSAPPGREREIDTALQRLAGRAGELINLFEQRSASPQRIVPIPAAAALSQSQSLPSLPRPAAAAPTESTYTRSSTFPTLDPTLGSRPGNPSKRSLASASGSEERPRSVLSDLNRPLPPAPAEEPVRLRPPPPEQRPTSYPSEPRARQAEAPRPTSMPTYGSLLRQPLSPLVSPRTRARQLLEGRGTPRSASPLSSAGSAGSRRRSSRRQREEQENLPLGERGELPAYEGQGVEDVKKPVTPEQTGPTGQAGQAGGNGGNGNGDKESPQHGSDREAQEYLEQSQEVSVRERGV
ncbi:hypothetical protein CALVIDRAFT_398598 [Calocera viscosa TUFC12733]|uniref:Uncharacterized protein n=1 Tax=Calocera viscosa (strain TUFC12733) TaxID=1330018 RepID=A0A167PSE9_CALVF|nr:hypothetical protein CALVIDRAFT_398598 [Calocera viscosa TUFC12733]